MDPESHAHRRRRTAASERWRQVVEEYRRSNLRQREFCQRAGISISTLNWWLTKARRAGDVPAPRALTEVRLPPSFLPTVSPNEIWALEIVTRAGVTIRWRNALAWRDVVHILRDA
jgi:hypothetical protein